MSEVRDDPSHMACDLIELWAWGLGGPAARDVLSPEECARADRFVHARDRNRFIAAHARMRVILADYSGVDADALTFVAADNGKPWLVDAPNIHFNLSHSDDLAVLAVRAAGPIGVDIERLRAPAVEDWSLVARRHFSPPEIELVTAASAHARADVFLRIWTRKEAVVKAHGHGLSLALDAFDVNVCDAEPSVIRYDESLPPPRAWRLAHFEPAPGYLGALAAPDAGAALNIVWRER